MIMIMSVFNNPENTNKSIVSSTSRNNDSNNKGKTKKHKDEKKIIRTVSKICTLSREMLKPTTRPWPEVPRRKPSSRWQACEVAGRTLKQEPTKPELWAYHLTMSSSTRTPKDHINIRILQSIISGITLVLALEPECEILVSLLYYIILHYIIAYYVIPYYIIPYYIIPYYILHYYILPYYIIPYYNMLPPAEAPNDRAGHPPPDAGVGRIAQAAPVQP